MFSFLNRRDLQKYPKDRVGDQLYDYIVKNKWLDGSQDAELDFVLEFTQESNAKLVATELDRWWYSTSIEHYPRVPDGPEFWEVIAVKKLPPTYLEINQVVGKLTELAKDHDGRFGYWLG